MSAYVCKICNLSSDEITDFILCKGNCKQYLHYNCGNIPEERFRRMDKEYKRKWKCEDCRKGPNSKNLDSETDSGNPLSSDTGSVEDSSGNQNGPLPNTENGLNALRNELFETFEDCRKGPNSKNLDSETDSGNPLSSDIGSVEDSLVNQNGPLPNTENELNALRNELFETVSSLEQLRTSYNEIAVKVADFEQQMRAQATNLNKVSEDVRDANKTVYTLGQNVRYNRLEIHGLFLRSVLSDEITKKIVEVGNCFGVQFSVEDIDTVDILTKTDPQRPVLVVHFVSKRVRDNLIAARKKKVINANLKNCSDETRIYINENLSSHFKSLWHQARGLAKRKGFKFVWVREGKLFIKKDSDSLKKRITCKADLDELETN